MTLQEMARPELLAAAPDSEIRQAFHRLSQLYGAARGRGGAVETYVNAAVFVIGEMERRGFRVSEDLPLVRASRTLSRKAAVRGEAGDVPEAVKPVLSGLPEEIVLVRDFVSLVGSAAVAEEPADLDVLVRAAYDARRDAYALHGPSVNVSLRRFLDPEKSRGLHFIDSPQGPFTDYIPLYDLVFRRRAPYVERIEPEPARYERKRRVIKDSLAKAIRLGVPFTPMKGRGGYHVGEFFDFDSLWTFWAKDVIGRGKEIAVQTKYDGIRMVIHKIGRTVRIFTEDEKRDRARIFPEIVQEVRALPAQNTILDTEFVWWREGEPIAREDMLAFVSGKEPITGEEIHVNCHDCLWQGREPLDGLGYLDRLKHLREVLPKDFDSLKFAPYRLASTEEELKAACAWAYRYPGSEGAMLKVADSPYSEERTDTWAKLKRVLEVAVQVIGRRRKAGPWKTAPKRDLAGDEARRAYGELARDSATFLYRAAIRDGDRLVPIEANARLMPSDLELAWDGEHQEWRGLESPEVWEMAEGYERNRGDLKLAATYASNIEAKIGDIITVQTARLERFDDEAGSHYSWMFPRVKETNPDKDRPDAAEDFERLIAAQGKTRLSKQAYENLEEEHTRIGQAQRFWNESWQTMFPRAGSGRFAYQHHWRGLAEDETELPEARLFETDHSVHGDLRFERDAETLWGVTVFLGTAEENRKAGGDRLAVLPEGDNLEISHKLAQPHAWLTVGEDKPVVSGPGEVGATAKKFSKFFLEDSGEYRMGVWREHSQEVFLEGKKLSGRFLLVYFPAPGGRRVWIIDRPDDQTPIAAQRGIKDEIAELRGKRQAYLIWAMPGKRPIPIKISGRPPEGFVMAETLLAAMDDTKDPWKAYEKASSGNVRKTYFIPFAKADEEKRLVYGVVLEPDALDAQGDQVSAPEIEQAAHAFLERSRVLGEGHVRRAKAEVLESYIAQKAFDLGDQEVAEGSWVLCVRVDDPDLWQRVKAGEITGFSVGGFGKRD